MRCGTVRVLNHGSFIPQMRGVLMSCQPRSVRGEVVTRMKARFGCRTRIFPPSPPHLLDRFCALIHLQLILYRTSDYPPSCPFSMPPLVALRPTALAPPPQRPPFPRSAARGAWCVARATATSLLALDFDGVLCDSCGESR